MIRNSNGAAVRAAAAITLAMALGLVPVSAALAQRGAQPAASSQPDSQPEKDNDGALEKMGDAADKVGDAATRIVERPLKDFNIMKTKVDPVLEAVMDDPYSLKGLRTCSAWRGEVARMTKALGPDVDSSEVSTGKKGDSSAEFALGAGEAVANTFIPGGGLIRKISGAEKRQKYALAAVYAGSVRRAYLKGVMYGKNCRR